MSQTLFNLLLLSCGVGVGLIILLLKKKKQEEKPKDPDTPPKTSFFISQIKQKVKELSTNKKTLGTTALVVIGVFFLLFLLLHPEGALPYLFVPMISMFARYFPTETKYQTRKYALIVGVLATVLVFLWTQPEVVAVLNEIMMHGFSLSRGGNYLFNYIVGGIIFLLVISGHIIEGMLVGILLILFF